MLQMLHITHNVLLCIIIYLLYYCVFSLFLSQSLWVDCDFIRKHAQLFIQVDKQVWPCKIIYIFCKYVWQLVCTAWLIKSEQSSKVKLVIQWNTL